MTLRFWQGWPRDNRIFFIALFVVFAVSIANMWVAYFVTPSPTIHLQTINEAEVNEIPVDQFSKGPFDFTVRGNNYVILQRQLGSLLETNDTVAYTYLFVMAIFVIGMLSVISTLGRFYYLVGMGVFILFVTTLSPEVVGVFGAYGKTFTITIMALYGLTSFWLFYFATTTSFKMRMLIFTGITFFIWSCIYFFSTTEKPFLFIATYSAEAGLIACGLFIVTVAHEIVAGFVTAVTQSPKTRKSINHFLIISGIYILNLVLAYSVRFDFLRWNLITVDLFLLLTISGILGVWGIRQRQKIYEGIIDSDPYAVFAFLLTGAFTFATIAMFMYNANDTALAAISDVIIFSHIGFGFIFLTYVISNFGGMMQRDYQVYKVLYSPTTMPFFTFRFAGLILTVALLFYNAWQVPLHNAMSGYFNGIADLYMKLDNKRIAQAYYDQSRTYGFRGHHANYALANIEGTLFNATEERSFYTEASGLRPTQMSVLNLAQSFQGNGDNLSAIVTLGDGARKLNNHKAIDNTLGLLYAKAGLADSASKYITKSKSPSNLIGLAALKRIALSDTVNLSEDPLIVTNQLALANSIGRRSGIKFNLPKDTVLSLPQAAGISNYLINTRNNEDTTFVNQVIALARKPSNSGYKEALLFASAIALYNSGETREAFTTLEEVTVGSEHQGRYNNILTMWALENDEPQRASGYAEYALQQNYAPANLVYAVALTESLKFKEASSAWDSLKIGTDSLITVLAGRMHNAMAGTLNGDEEVYIFARYRLTVADSSQIFALAPFITDDNVKAKVLLDFAQKLYSIDKPSAALHSLNRIVGLQLTDARIGEQMQVLELLARVRMGSVKEVIDALKQNPVDFKGKNKRYKIYFNALAAEQAGDSTNANKYYQWLGTNPFFEDGLIAAAKYFKNKGTVGYNLLADGLLYHPSSIKIRKAFALESARIGFDDYALRAVDELRPFLNTTDYSLLSKEVLDLIKQRE
jgi:hypothetical protein